MIVLSNFVLVAIQLYFLSHVQSGLNVSCPSKSAHSHDVADAGIEKW